MKRHRILEKSLLIIEYVSQHNGVSLTELSEFAELSKSSAHALVHTMADMNYLSREERTGLYYIGLKSFEVGSRYVENNDIYRAAKEVLEGVSEASRETAHLAVLDGTDVVYICKHDSNQAIRMISYTGKRVPAHATAIGKALLTDYTNEELCRLYEGRNMERLTEHTITELDVLISQINQARMVGTAFEREESTAGVQCVAVPIHNREGKVVMAMSVSVPIFRSDDTMQPHIDNLRQGKQRMELMLR